MQNLFDLTGRVAVITGSTKGMGLEIARALGGAGAAVVVSGRDGAASQAVAATLQGEGIQAKGIACDIAEVASVRAFAEQAQAAFGRVDVLVLNAAASGTPGSMLSQGPEVFEEAMAGNVRGNLVLVNALAPQMIERRGGSILFMSSIAAKRGSAFLGMYGVTKAAADQAVRSLALELGPSGINVNAINPGPVRTEFSREALWGDPEREARLAAGIPMRRIGEARDVAGLALLLASEAGRFINGQSISVDGGLSVA